MEQASGSFMTGIRAYVRSPPASSASHFSSASLYLVALYCSSILRLFSGEYPVRCFVLAGYNNVEDVYDDGGPLCTCFNP